MVIRDDRGKAYIPFAGHPPLVPRPGERVLVPRGSSHFAPDRVLYDCPECGRSHFVTVDACPDEALAAAETAMSRKAA